MSKMGTKKHNEPVTHRRATCLTPQGLITHGFVAAGDIELDFAQRDQLLPLEPSGRLAKMSGRWPDRR